MSGKIGHESGNSDEFCQILSGLSISFLWPVIYKAALIPWSLKDIFKSFILAGIFLAHDLHLLETPLNLHKTSIDKE